MKREEIIKRLADLNREQTDLKEKLSALEKSDKLERALQWVGKFYIEDDASGDYVMCLHVYGIEEETSELLAVRNSHWENHHHHYQIEYVSYFRPWEVDPCFKWKEITEEEYVKHFQTTLDKIAKSQHLIKS